MQNAHDNDSVTGAIGTFGTQRLPLAIFLHAAHRLIFARCARAGSDKVLFLFEDPAGEGPLAELEFEQGATVMATALFASQRFLRRKMSEALNDKRRIGTQHEDQKRSNYQN
jgi:hypothetical protein